MQAMNRFKLGGNLLIIGTSLALFTKALWWLLIILKEQNIPKMYHVFSSLFGTWFATLVIPYTIEGKTIEFKWSMLLWVPWAAVFIIFLLWLAVKVIRGKFNIKFVPIIGVFGLWSLIGLLYGIITRGFHYFEYNLFWFFYALFADVSNMLMIVAIGLIIFNYKKGMKYAVEEVPMSRELTLSDILFSFEGRINRAKYWLYQVLILNLIFVACIVIGASVDNRDGIIAGYILGLLIIIWPGLAVAVKRCHDRNRSGAFILVSLIPFVGLWYAIEVLFLKGTEGDNKYGPDPLRPSEKKEDN